MNICKFSQDIDPELLKGLDQKKTKICCYRCKIPVNYNNGGPYPVCKMCDLYFHNYCGKQEIFLENGSCCCNFLVLNDL